MFCSQCGQKLSPEAKFCDSCGTKTNTAQEVTLAKSVLPANWQEMHEKVSKVYENESWVLKALKSQTEWKGEHTFPNAIDEVALMRFDGKFGTTAIRKSEMLCTPGYLAFLGKKTLASSTLDLVIPADQIIQIQVGTATHTRLSGSSAQDTNFWHISIVTKRAGTGENHSTANGFRVGRVGLPISFAYFANGELDYFLPAGSTAFQQQNLAETYMAKLEYLSHFYNITLDGGHVQKTSGSNAPYAVGFWHSEE